MWHVLECLNEADERLLDDLSPTTIDPRWAARVYEPLAALETEATVEKDAKYLQTLFEAHQDDLRSIADAFEQALLPDLPDELKTFEHCFSQISPLAGPRLATVREQPEVKQFPFSEAMAVYGITPAMVLTATDSVSRLAERMMDRNLLKRELPLLLSVGNAESRLERQRFDYFLASDEVERATKCDRITAESLLRWCIGVGQSKPLLFDRFRADPETRFGVTLIFTGHDERNLFTRWGCTEPNVPALDEAQPESEEVPHRS